MRQLLLALLLLPLTGCSTHPPTQHPTGPHLHADADPEAAAQRWTLVDSLSDEFDRPEIDHAKWQTHPVGNGWFWNGRPPGLFHPRNVNVADGTLNVTVSKLNEPHVEGNKTFLYQGAIVRSIHPAGPGLYVEARMKANATEMSSTFWLMTKGNSVKKLELDVQECVGRTTEQTADWGRNWDEIFHSNVMHRINEHNPEKVQLQGQVKTPTKNHQRYYVYAAWWKSPEEIRFYLDGQYAYTITPEFGFDVPAHLQMAMETYDWNPVPDEGSLVEHGTEDQRTTRYDWIRVWRPQ